MKVADRRPDAVSPNDWPYQECKAFGDLIDASELRDELHPVDRVILAARELGLGPRHWLVYEVLVCAFQKFPIHGGEWFAEDAESFLRNATDADLVADAPTVHFARRLAGVRHLLDRIEALEEALEGVAPEKPTTDMVLAGAKAMSGTSTENEPLTAVIYGQPRDVWAAMWLAWKVRNEGGDA